MLHPYATTSEINGRETSVWYNYDDTHNPTGNLFGYGTQETPQNLAFFGFPAFEEHVAPRCPDF